MNCSRFETLLSDYLERTLEPPVQQAARAHLESCPSCQSLYGEVGILREQLQAFPTVEAPEDLVDRILVKTTGRPRTRSLWADMIVPTVRPFLTQRYAFATVMLFVFLSLMVNLAGPPAGAVLSPSRLAESADRATVQLNRTWAEIQDFKNRVFKEATLLTEDLSGRLDYHLISLLFKSYSESVSEQRQGEEAPQEDNAAEPSPEEN